MVLLMALPLNSLASSLYFWIRQLMTSSARLGMLSTQVMLITLEGAAAFDRLVRVMLLRRPLAVMREGTIRMV